MNSVVAGAPASGWVAVVWVENRDRERLDEENLLGVGYFD
jgi:hypothetical protein